MSEFEIAIGVLGVLGVFTLFGFFLVVDRLRFLSEHVDFFEAQEDRRYRSCSESIDGLHVKINLLAAESGLVYESPRTTAAHFVKVTTDE